MDNYKKRTIIMDNYKKIIFLDIDGVLASIPYLVKRNGFIDPKKIELLNQLTDTGAEVVISSSWGYDNGRTEESLKNCGLILPIIGYTEHMDYPWSCRGNEIEKWILDNLYKKKEGLGTKYGKDYYRHHTEGDTDYEYVILDDDSDMLLGQQENFIQVNSYYGLTRRHINLARKILDRKLKYIDIAADKDLVEGAVRTIFTRIQRE